MQKLLQIAAALIVGLLGIALWHEHTRLETLRAQDDEKFARLDEQIQHLRLDLEDARKSTRTTEVAAPKESAELARIRGAIGELRRRTEILEQKPAVVASGTNAVPEPAETYVYPDSTHKKDYTFAGFVSTTSATESLLWAISKLDRKAFESTMTPEEAKYWANAFEDLPPDVMPGGFRNGAMYKATGFKLLEETPVSDSEVKAKVFLEGQNHVLKLIFKKVGNDWKWAGDF